MAVKAPGVQLPGGSQISAQSYGTVGAQDGKRGNWRKLLVIGASMAAVMALTALVSSSQPATPTELSEASALRIAEGYFGNSAIQDKQAAKQAGLAQANPKRTASLSANFVHPFKSLASTPVTKKNEAKLDAEASKEAKAMVDAAFARAQVEEKVGVKATKKPKLAVQSKGKEQALANLQKKTASAAESVTVAKPAVVTAKKPVAKSVVHVVHEKQTNDDTAGQRKLALALNGRGVKVSQGGQYIGKNGKVTDDGFLPLAKIFDMADRTVSASNTPVAKARTGQLAEAKKTLPGVKVHTKGLKDPFSDVKVAGDAVGKHTLWWNS
mmetsp:Transcript_6585/g.10409  ORF Transcript_6585/g.10409 Transcript_6585/m.10409 type:complete len:325 (-) Transcript_6585:1197-2171(-)